MFLYFGTGPRIFTTSRQFSKSTEMRRSWDIHHIFPKRWCEINKIPARRFNAIVNKTAISAKANRSIGGKAPSSYLLDIQNNKKVALAAKEMNEILRTHLIDPALLRLDDFAAFYESRKGNPSRSDRERNGQTTVARWGDFRATRR